MQLQEQSILFFTRTMNAGGTEGVILQLCEIFKPLVRKIVVCSSGGVYEKRLKELEIKHFTIPDIERKNITVIWKVKRAIQSIICEEGITVVHTHHRMAAFYCQMLSSKKNLILINTSHTAFDDKKLLTKIAFRGFHLVACGEGVKESMVDELGLDVGRITVICNGVRGYIQDNNKSNKDKRNGICISSHTFAYIGRISAEKGLDYLVKAMGLINNKQIKCLVVGAGPAEGDVCRQVANEGLQERFIFAGYREDVKDIMAQVDFMVQPSLQEGLPLVVIEAFSVGKTVVGTNIRGIREVIQDKVNGILVPPCNPAELAKAIEYLYSIDRKPLERAALETYKEKYSYETFASSYLELYKSIR